MDDFKQNLSPSLTIQTQIFNHNYLHCKYVKNDIIKQNDINNK